MPQEAAQENTLAIHELKYVTRYLYSEIMKYRDSLISYSCIYKKGQRPQLYLRSLDSASTAPFHFPSTCTYYLVFCGTTSLLRIADSSIKYKHIPNMQFACCCEIER